MQADVERDRDRRSGRGGGERRTETAVGEDRRRDAARQRPQLGERVLRVEQRAADQGLRRRRVVDHAALGGLQVHRQPDEALLRPVVDVPLHLAQGAGLGVDRRGPGRGQPVDPARRSAFSSHSSALASPASMAASPR